jgi:hypothetical protein
MTAMMNDHPEDRAGLLTGGGVELVVQPQRDSDDPEPGQLPCDFEQQDGKHAERVTKAHQRQDRHRDEHALDGAVLQLPRAVVEQQWPLDHCKAPAHDEVTHAQQVQLPE